jgi:hypothetical protein
VSRIEIERECKIKGYVFTLGLGGLTSVFIFTPVGFFTSVEVFEDPVSFFMVLPKEDALVICEDKRNEHITNKILTKMFTST